MICLIVLQSVTYAQRAENVLGRYGISVNMVRAQPQFGGGSCSYAIKFRADTPKNAIDILKHNAVPYKKVYVANERGGYSEYN